MKFIISCLMLFFHMSIGNAQKFIQGENTSFSIGAPSIIDINADDKVDIVGLEKRSFGTVGELVVYTNTSDIGSINFERTYLDVSGIGAPAIGDMNGDGIDDIVVSEYNGDSAVVVVLYHLGDMMFVKDTISEDNLYRHDIADIDNDGDMDLVSTNRDIDVMVLYENDGNQIFTQVATLSGDDLYAAQFNDIDEDGDMDIIIGHDDFFDSKFLKWSNNGDGTFVEEVMAESSAGGLLGFVILDFDKDGFKDLLFNTRSSPRLRILNQSSDGLFQDSNLYSGPDAVKGFGTANFDSKDGKDILIGRNDDGIDFLVNSETGPIDFFDAENVSGVSPAEHLVPADLDGDGDLDVIVSNGGFWWLENVMEQGSVNVIESSLETVRIYPNPVGQWLFLDKIIDGDILILRNLFGVPVLQTKGPMNKLNLQNLPSGIYTLTIENALRKYIFSQFVIKQ